MDLLIRSFIENMDEENKKGPNIRNNKIEHRCNIQFIIIFTIPCVL